MQKQSVPVNLVIAPEMFDARAEQIARPANDSVNNVILFQKQLGKIRAILAGNTRDQSDLIVILHLTLEFHMSETMSNFLSGGLSAERAPRT